ncbi:UMP kinase [Endothiovibrio diazotrophicus]
MYRRILLKLSGEVLMGSDVYGISPDVADRIAGEIRDVVKAGTQVGMVIGGGNIFRGAGLASGGMDRVVGDQMGMLATVMNSLAMAQYLEKIGVPARVMSAFAIEGVCERFQRDQAVRHLEAGRVVLFAGGSGNPFFTTDSAASLRAIEIGAEVLFKATKVSGVYSADPVKDPAAEHFPRLSYDEVLDRRLMVMDLTAIVLCRDHAMPLRIFNINNHGDLPRICSGEEIGSLVEG